jgi:hypothetical protein
MSLNLGLLRILRVRQLFDALGAWNGGCDVGRSCGEHGPGDFRRGR